MLIMTVVLYLVENQSFQIRRALHLRVESAAKDINVNIM